MNKANTMQDTTMAIKVGMAIAGESGMYDGPTVGEKIN